MERCSDCGKPISHRLKGKCMACRYKEIQNKSEEKQDLKRCAVCGKLFRPYSGSSKMCSDACRKERIRRQQSPNYGAWRTERECEICGKTYIPKAKNQKTCSPECSKVLHNQLVMTRYFKHAKERKKSQKKREPVAVDITGRDISSMATVLIGTSKPASKPPRLRIDPSRMPYRGEPTRECKLPTREEMDLAWLAEHAKRAQS
ncbi:MAG: hypothetical protein E7238_00385 [Sarcina sp.]|nr:hypothetical protein [Sarcina sp.]